MLHGAWVLIEQWGLWTTKTTMSCVKTCWTNCNGLWMPPGPPEFQSHHPLQRQSVQTLYTFSPLLSRLLQMGAQSPSPSASTTGPTKTTKLLNLGRFVVFILAPITHVNLSALAPPRNHLVQSTGYLFPFRRNEQFIEQFDKIFFSFLTLHLNVDVLNSQEGHNVYDMGRNRRKMRCHHLCHLLRGPHSIISE